MLNFCSAKGMRGLFFREFSQKCFQRLQQIGGFYCGGLVYAVLVESGITVRRYVAETNYQVTVRDALEDIGSDLA